jgi:hypothetical protein
LIDLGDHGLLRGTAAKWKNKNRKTLNEFNENDFFIQLFLYKLKSIKKVTVN